MAGSECGSIIQNVSELLQRIDDQFSITDQDGATFLLSTWLIQEVMQSGTPPLGTHFSTALAAALPLTVSQSDQAPIAAKEISGTASLDSTTNMRNENVDRPDQMVSQTNINALGQALGIFLTLPSAAFATNFISSKCVLQRFNH
ncbi:hypothetical protein B0H13DRAFT_2349162 [Mycena leptocephala]|nr:hypothetical protein B0H13DRAFT_2349162 [Mycena leptocephala]